jgi:hypothetical protein
MAAYSRIAKRVIAGTEFGGVQPLVDETISIWRRWLPDAQILP